MCPSGKMMEFVNGKDDIPYMKWKIKKKLKPPTSFFLNLQQRNGLRKASSLKKMDLSKASAESWKVNWSINL